MNDESPNEDIKNALDQELPSDLPDTRIVSPVAGSDKKQGFQKWIFVVGGVATLVIVLGLGGYYAFMIPAEEEKVETHTSKIKKPHLGTTLSAALVDSRTEDGWYSALTTNQILAPEQITTTLYEEPTEAIRMRTEGAGTASIISREVEIPDDAHLFSFCYKFPQGGDGDWLTVHLQPTGTALADATLLLSLRGDTASSFGKNIYGDTFMLDADAWFLGGVHDGTLRLTLHGFGEQPAEVILTEFHFLSERDIDKRLQDKDAAQDCLIEFASTEDEIFDEETSKEFNEKLANLATEAKKFEPEEQSFISQKLATISPLVKSVNTVKFSPGGDQVAYVGRTDPGRAVTGILFLGDKLLSDRSPWPFVFSQNGEHFAYVESNGNGGKQLVFNGEVHSINSTRVKDFDFVPGSDTLIYQILRNRVWRIVLDGAEGAPYDNIDDLTFSPDGKRLAYVAKKGDQTFVVDGNKESNPYRFIERPIFSPNSQRLGFEAVEGRQQIQSIVVDGQEGGWYEWIGGFTFSPDSTTIAYPAQGGEHQFIVVDGVEGKRYDRVLEVMFKPDSNTVIYKAMELGDGECKGAVPDPEGTIEFEGLDGKHRCTNTTNDSWFLVVGDEEEAKYNAVGRQVFFSPSGEMIYFVRDHEGMLWVVHGDQRISILGDGSFFSLDASEGGQIAYRVKDGEEWYAVVNGVQKQRFEGVNPPIFIGDTDKAFYKVSQGNKEALSIDDRITEYYDRIFLDTLTFDETYTKVAFGVQKGNELWWIVEDL